MAPAFGFITFTTDYGLEDEFVGVCHGVIKRFAPDVQILDITHGIQAQDIVGGATVLAQAIAFMPPAVHLAVVDPGVGTARRGVVIISKSGMPLVGPDNGLLWLAAQELGGIEEAHEISNKSLFLSTPSKTFHGRDIFSPVAARLAAGLDPNEVGAAIEIDSLVKLQMAFARVDDDHVHGQVVMADHFGNLQLNVHRQDLEGAGILLGDGLELRVGGKSYSVPYCEAFAEVPQGKLAILEDAYRHMTIVVNQGNAAKQLEARRSDPVILARLPKAAVH
ncbi:MAG: SAM hydrolase/SAM-dependent halogenase family protein [Actinomycetota bacterium]